MQTAVQPEQGAADDPMWERWKLEMPRLYDAIYYQINPIITYVDRAGHVLLERPFSANDHFSSVLEVGGGTGQHIAHVRHGFDRYVFTDIDPLLLDIAEQRTPARPGLTFEQQDATHLTYSDGTFDRLISVYNLEHLPHPHAVLKEWMRVIRPGGILSIAIPTEGGIAWNLGRYLTTRRYFKREGLDLDYIIAREHINACYRLVSLIKHYFPQRREIWFPTRIPLAHCNLLYATTITINIAEPGT